MTSDFISLKVLVCQSVTRCCLCQTFKSNSLKLNMPNVLYNKASLMYRKVRLKISDPKISVLMLITGSGSVYSHDKDSLLYWSIQCLNQWIISVTAKICLSHMQQVNVSVTESFHSLFIQNINVWMFQWISVTEFFSLWQRFTRLLIN